MNLIEKEHEVILQTYKRLPIEVDYALGARIFDKNGNEYLDFLGGIAVNALGHSHPEIIKAIQEQAPKYLHISNYFYQEPQIKLAEKLCQMSGYSKVFFSNSGTEATEGAIKLVRRWASDKDKSNIFAFSGGFHGRTYGALSIMDKPLYKEKMGPFLADTFVIKYNDIDELKANINEKTAGVFLEFIQGEGGISSISQEFAEELIKLKNKFNFLIVADEIQAGTGRTGDLFAFEKYCLRPDIITMAKGIGGGLPLGGFLVDSHLESIFEKGMHGTTYGGNALACTTGLVVLNELEKSVFQNVKDVGLFFINELKKIQEKYPQLINEVRGRGLILGLSLTFDATILMNKLLDKHIITNAASGTVLRLVPPLIITKEDVKLFIEKLDLLLSEM
jgi:predicted acetylornithine/succinylornithine family transaminase